jgi:ribosome biogenesis GTPase
MAEWLEGRVTRVDARLVFVEVAGEVRPFALRGKLFERQDQEQKSPVAVGDVVRVGLAGDPPGLEQVLPRRNWLSRVASSHDPREQVLFANADLLCVVASVNKPRFSSNRNDRILVACAYAEIPGLLVLNKSDLDKRGEAELLARTYRAAGIPVLQTSAHSEQGLPELAAHLRGKVTAFYGASGVGKSSLLNALEPGFTLRIGKVSKYWDTGRHTTSASQMMRLPTLAGYAIDTPGVRVFRPYGINRRELPDQFPEFAPHREQCRFPGCSHDHEPDCAVFAAVERGAIAPTRYASYLEILDELGTPSPADEADSPSGSGGPGDPETS